VGDRAVEGVAQGFARTVRIAQIDADIAAHKAKGKTPKP
jgi:hypothetical protein